MFFAQCKTKNRVMIRVLEITAFMVFMLMVSPLVIIGFGVCCIMSGENLSSALKDIDIF